MTPNGGRETPVFVSPKCLLWYCILTCVLCFLGVNGTDQAFKDRHRNRNVTETGAKTPSARWSHFVRLITIDHTPTPGQVRSRTFVDAGYFAHLGMVLLSLIAIHVFLSVAEPVFFFFLQQASPTPRLVLFAES